MGDKRGVKDNVDTEMRRGGGENREGQRESKTINQSRTKGLFLSVAVATLWNRA